MAWLFGQTWLWYLLSFAVGVLLAWAVFVLPAQQRSGGAAPAPAPAPQPVAAPAAAPAPADAATEQLPAVDPALSTLDARSGAAGIGAAGVAALGAAGVSDGDTVRIPVVAGAFPGSALPRDGGAAPTPAHTVKGNARSMLYHTTASPYYSRTVAEVWFTSAADAEAAGFTDVRTRRRG